MCSVQRAVCNVQRAEKKRRKEEAEKKKKEGRRREEKSRFPFAFGSGDETRREEPVSICFRVKARQDKRIAGFHLLLGQKKRREEKRRKEK